MSDALTKQECRFYTAKFKDTGFFLEYAAFLLLDLKLPDKRIFSDYPSTVKALLPDLQKFIRSKHPELVTTNQAEIDQLNQENKELAIKSSWLACAGKQPLKPLRVPPLKTVYLPISLDVLQEAALELKLGTPMICENAKPSKGVDDDVVKHQLGKPSHDEQRNKLFKAYCQQIKYPIENGLFVLPNQRDTKKMIKEAMTNNHPEKFTKASFDTWWKVKQGRKKIAYWEYGDNYTKS